MREPASLHGHNGAPCAYDEKDHFYQPICSIKPKGNEMKKKRYFKLCYQVFEVRKQHCKDRLGQVKPSLFPRIGKVRHGAPLVLVGPAM